MLPPIGKTHGAVDAFFMKRVRRAFTLDAVERELYGASKAMQRTQHFKALNDSCAKDVFIMDDADDDLEAMTIDVCSNS